MSNSLSLLLFFLSLLPLSLSQPKGIFIDCGAEFATEIDGLTWQPDAAYVFGGTPRVVSYSRGALADPTLVTARAFPNVAGAKYCYTARVYRGARYAVRATYYFYGAVGPPPVFDQVVDGTLWGTVNTTAEFAAGEAAYYEGVFEAHGNTMSVCVAANEFTESEPFISALELVILDQTVYNSTDFNSSALLLVERSSFGYDGPLIRYPDDKFDRYWAPFGANNLTPVGSRNISVSGFWNVPPQKIFAAELSTGPTQPLELSWPSAPLPDAYYYIALYFAESNHSASASPRAFRVAINGVTFFEDLKPTVDGVAVFATRWRLSGPTKITLTPLEGSSLGPLINGGEIFEVHPLNGTTLTRDVIAMEKLKEGLQSYPLDWSGDPCMPGQYSWTGVTCSEGPRIRIISLNLTGMGISGTLSPGIAKMTALTDIWLGNNKLSGPIPDLSSLKRLETLHLEDNLFGGEIPASLGSIETLRELFLQNNNLTGHIPTSLTGKRGLTLRVSGNSLLFTPPPPS